MTRKYCPECGSLNPGSARFCMECGTGLVSEATDLRPGPPASHTPAPTPSGTDWAGLAAGFLAGLSARRMSRKARQTTMLVVFLLVFFGCPMACGTIAFLVEAVARLLGQG